MIVELHKSPHYTFPSIFKTKEVCICRERELGAVAGSCNRATAELACVDGDCIGSPPLLRAVATPPLTAKGCVTSHLGPPAG